MIQRGGGKEGKKRRKSSVKDVTLLVVQDEVVEIEVPFDLLVFDSIQDANSAGHYFLDAYFTDLHVPVLPMEMTSQDFALINSLTLFEEHDRLRQEFQ